MSGAFPVITSDVATRYISTARLTPNAVARRIRALLPPTMAVACMYCGRVYKRIACIEAMRGKVSHGVCESVECLNRLERDYGFSPSSLVGAVKGVAESNQGCGDGDSTFSCEPCSSAGPSVPAKDCLEGELGLRPQPIQYPAAT